MMMRSSMVDINPKAKIADDVTINSFVTIAGDVEIGEGTWIGPNVTIMDGARIGRNCRIFPGAVIGAIPQDLKFDGEITYAYVGDNTTIRECATVNRGTRASGKTVVGSDCLLMAYSHVAHDCVVGNHCILANSVALGGHVVLGDWVVMGGLSAAHQFVHIGDHVMLAAGCITTKDLPPYITAGGETVSYMGINSIGLRRRGFESQQIDAVQDIYRILYMSGKNVSNAVELIKETVADSPERQNVLSFVLNATRGIIRGFAKR